MHKVAVVTGGRADYGLLTPLLKAIDESAALRLQLVVTGYHLSAAHGETWRQIEADGFAIAARVESQLASDSRLGMVKSLGLGVLGFSDTLTSLSPDALVLLGDRYEVLAAAQAALLLNIPIIHLHGGELTQGAVDDVIRHTISKMAALHLVATETYRQRLLQMGEAESTVVLTGPTAVDKVAQLQAWSLSELNQQFGLALKPGFILVTLHPETVGGGDPARLADMLCEALTDFVGRSVLITGSNADAGGGQIDARLKAWAQDHPACWHRPALGWQGYLSAAALAGVVVGNSSSGMLEVPILGTPVVNLGCRQQGRHVPAGVWQAEAEPEAIKQAVWSALQIGHQNPCKDFGEPGVAKRMVDIICLALDRGLYKLPFVDRPFSAS